MTATFNGEQAASFKRGGVARFTATMNFALPSSSGLLSVVTEDFAGNKSEPTVVMIENGQVVDPTNLITEEHFPDAALLAAVKEQKEVDGDRIFLMGWSTGSYLSMITAYNDENAAGCILCGVPSTFEEIIPILVRNHPAGKTEAELIVHEDFPKEQMPALIAPDFKKPIMIIAGSKDDRTPQWMAEKIYDALPEDTFKRLSIFENAGHGGTDAPYFVDTPRYVEETATFILEAAEQNQYN